MVEPHKEDPRNWDEQEKVDFVWPVLAKYNLRMLVVSENFLKENHEHYLSYRAIIFRVHLCLKDSKEVPCARTTS